MKKASTVKIAILLSLALLWALPAYALRCGTDLVTLGKTGINFGAGMTGGLAFVLDQERQFVDCYNHELIDIHRITPEIMEAHLNFLRELIADYNVETGSKWGQTVHEDFLDLVGRFWLIKPKAADLETLLDTLLEAA